jgi:DNA-directed RNA polymerase specialized sigma24 family protein
MHSVRNVTAEGYRILLARVTRRTRRWPRVSLDLRRDAVAHAVCEALRACDVPHWENWVVRVACNWLHRQVFRQRGLAGRRHYPETFAEHVPTRTLGALAVLLDAERNASEESAVATALGACSDMQRRVLLRHYVDGVPYETLAAEMGSTSAAVKAAAERGRKAFRAAWQLHTGRDAPDVSTAARPYRYRAAQRVAA